MPTASAAKRPQPNAREAAKGYIARGWSIVPVPAHNKGPVLDRWQRGGFRADDVDPADNIGLLLGKVSSRLTDVDLDTLEAIAAAPYLLPATDMRHGRPSKLSSHWWYCTTDGEMRTTRYRDPDGSTLVELRGTGAQTIVPPSVHPSGELLSWESDGEPACVKTEALHRAVAHVAACAMVAKRWPQGSRHDVALASAGLLCRGGMAQHDTERIMEVVARTAGDPEWGDRVRAVQDTAAEIAAGKPATGGPRLAQLLPDGEQVVGKLRDWLGLRSEIETEDVPPLDVFGDATLAGSPDVSLDTLPAVIADFAADTAARLGCDPVSVALPAIVVSAAAIDDGYVIQPRRFDTGWLESARLNVAIVAASGDHKTPAEQAAVQALRDAEARWSDDDRRALQRYEIERRVYARKIDQYVKAGGLDPLPDEPKRPPVRRLVTADCTIEALSEILQDNPHGVLLHADELTGWLGSFDTYRSGAAGRDRALWLQTWNGGPQPVDRVRRGRVLVPNWSVCIVGGIQPEPMRKLAGKLVDDGLLQRFLVGMARPSVRGEDREPKEQACRAYRDAIFRLVDLPAPIQRRIFTLSEEAHLERETVETAARNVQILPDTSNAFRAHLSKWPGIFARLVLTFHVLESPGLDPMVSGAIARKTARLMLDYLLPNTARFYADVLGHEHMRHARWVAGYILSHGKERITAREIGRACHELYQDRTALFSAMESLTLAGWVTPTDTPGKQPSSWLINRRVHALFVERARQERERREAVRAEIAQAARALCLTEVEA
jgi:hypothetical protein